MPNSQTRIPGYFPMLGGPAFGANALVGIIKHYGWDRVATYNQNFLSDVVTSETFVSLAMSQGVQLALQKRESSTAEGKEVDLQDLLDAKSNIFIFFGGSQLEISRKTKKAFKPVLVVCI
jgi:hypothetical protein